jgi:hypothetical protein
VWGSGIPTKTPRSPLLPLWGVIRGLPFGYTPNHPPESKAPGYKNILLFLSGRLSNNAIQTFLRCSGGKRDCIYFLMFIHGSLMFRFAEKTLEFYLGVIESNRLRVKPHFASRYWKSIRATSNNICTFYLTPDLVQWIEAKVLRERSRF